MPKKKKNETDKKEHSCEEICPFARIFSHFEERSKSDPPEFVKHFMNAHKEVLLGMREMIDWKIEKIEEKTKPRAGKKVKKVEIQ